MSKYSIGVCLDINDGLYEELFSYQITVYNKTNKKIRFDDFLNIILVVGMDTLKGYNMGVENGTRGK